MRFDKPRIEVTIAWAGSRIRDFLSFVDVGDGLSFADSGGIRTVRFWYTETLLKKDWEAENAAASEERAA